MIWPCVSACRVVGLIPPDMQEWKVLKAQTDIEGLEVVRVNKDEEYGPWHVTIPGPVGF